MGKKRAGLKGNMSGKKINCMGCGETLLVPWSWGIVDWWCWECKKRSGHRDVKNDKSLKIDKLAKDDIDARKMML